MSIVSVQPKSFILALFIRDDNERFLLGDNGYDFKDSQLHFAANTIENDEVQKQGADGVMIAGQVRRASVQSFDGFVGDATMAKETIEQMRRDFIAFFLKGHHYRVIYVDCNRNAWQRKGGYLVDAPEVKELWQIHPEYHVGLNFEDVNYYSYDEDADGNEILANLVNVPVSTEAEGGLVWDEDGAVSEDAGDIYYDTAESSASGKSIAISGATEAPLASFQLDGETSQNGAPTPSAPVAVNTTTGENVVQICGKNLLSDAVNTTTTNTGTTSTIQSTTWTIIKSGTSGISAAARTDYFPINLASGDSVIFSSTPVSGSFSGGTTFPQIIVYWYDANKTQLGYTTTASTSQDITAQAYSKTYTASSNVAYFRVGEYIPGTTTGTTTGVVLHLQLELGSAATAYEPYQGQSYEVNLGKNLFDKDNSAQILNNTYIHAQGMGASNGFATVYIPCDEGVVYTISKVLTSRFSVGTTADIPAVGVSVSSIVADNSATKMTYTTGAGSRYLVAQVRSSSDTLTVDEIAATIQIEKGSQATSYAAYFEPIELCKIGDYQDYIYKSGSKWYKHKAIGKVVLDGSVAPTATNTDATNTIRPRWESFLSPAPNSPAADRLLAKSNRFQAVSNWSADVEGIYYDEGNSGQVWFRISKTLASNQTQLVSWLQSNPVDLYYPLGLTSQTDTEITNEALIAQLNALLTTARTYAGVNNIFTITPNEQGTLEIGYYTKYQPMVGSGGYVWEAGGAGGPTVIINNSIDNVSPVWTIYGPTTNPQLENATTGETIEYVGTIAQGQTLTIDMGEQTASLDGLNVISNLVGDFVQLAPGRNNIIYSVSGEAGASELGWSEIVG